MENIQNKDTGEYAILISSSDGYKDCWEPFFKLFQLYFPLNSSINIYLVTNWEEYFNRKLNITTIKTNQNSNKLLPWSKRLKIALKNIDEDIILFLLDDYFIKSPVNIEELNKLVNLLKSNDNIAHIKLKSGSWGKKQSVYENLDKIKRFTKYRFSLQPGLWKKKVLEKYLINSESAWELEILGSVRSSILYENFYSVSKKHIANNGFVINCSSTGGIIKGKWDKDEVKPLFFKHGINIDFDKRGFITSNDKKNNKNNLQKKIILNIPRYIIETLVWCFQTYLKRRIKKY